MVWSWGHAPEAYEAARNNIFAGEREWLTECYAEWLATGLKIDDLEETEVLPNTFESSAFDQELYQSSLTGAEKLDNDTLAEAIWSFAARYQTCSNGGWECWCCPSGCHIVYFGRSEFKCDLCQTEVARPTRGAERDAGLCDACSKQWQADLKVGLQVRLLERQLDGTEIEHGIFEIERLVIVPSVTASTGIYVNGSALRFGVKDGYAKDIYLSWTTPYRTRRRLVRTESRLAAVLPST